MSMFALAGDGLKKGAKENVGGRKRKRGLRASDESYGRYNIVSYYTVNLGYIEPFTTHCNYA